MPNIKLKDAGGVANPYYDINTLSVPLSDGEGVATFISEHLIMQQKNADWNVTDPNDPAYIANKPEIFNAEDELPDASGLQDGLVLGVKNGEWAPIEVSTVESNLPEINKDTDEGKVLGVSNGEWAIVMPAAGGADWNAAENTLGYIANKPDNFVFSDDLETALAPYAQTAEIETILEDYTKTEDITETLKDYAKTEDITETLKDYAKTSEVENTLENYVKTVDAESTYAKQQAVNEAFETINTEIEGLIATDEQLNDNIQLVTTDLATYKEEVTQEFKNTQADWNLTSGLASVKNRPLYADGPSHNYNDIGGTWVASSFASNRYRTQSKFHCNNFTADKTFTVIWDGIVYENCECRDVTMQYKYQQNNTSHYRDFEVRNVIGNPGLWAWGDTATSYGNTGVKPASDYDIEPELPFVFSAFPNTAVSSAGDDKGLSDFDYVVTTTKGPHTLELYSDIKKVASYLLPDEALLKQVQSDWAETDSTKSSFILNKPASIEQIAADWTQTNPNAKDYIKNKPFGYQDDFFPAKEFTFVYDDLLGAYKTQINLPDIFHTMSPGWDYTETSFVLSWNGTKTQAITPKYTTWRGKTNTSDEYRTYALGNSTIYPCDPNLYETPKTNNGPNEKFLLCWDNIDGAWLYTYEPGAHSFGMSLSLKPTQRLDKSWLPADVLYSQTQADWNEKSTSSPAYIKNKPSDTYYQANWNEKDSAKPGFIQNKPTLFTPKNTPYEGDQLIYNGNAWEAIKPHINWESETFCDLGYIYNKPFGVIDTIIPEKTIQLNAENKKYAEGGWNLNLPASISPNDIVDLNQTYTLTVNDSTYVTKVYNFATSSSLIAQLCPIVFGNPYLLSLQYGSVDPQCIIAEALDNGLPYCYYLIGWGSVSSWKLISRNSDVTTATVKVTTIEPITKKLDKKYLPDDLLDNLQIKVDTTLSQAGMAADAKTVGTKLAQGEKMISDIDKRIYFGEEYAGQLLFIGEDGYPTRLMLGRGLSIKNNVLMVVESSETTAELDVCVLDTMVLPDE